jgi:hypothetical protein
MTTEMLEFDRWSARDTDLSAAEPLKAERARTAVVRVWSTERKNPTSHFFSRSHLTGAESYEIDSDSWRHFDRALNTHVTLAHLHVVKAFPTDMMEKRAPFVELLTHPLDPKKKVDRRRRYAELSKLLDEWTNDPSDFDECVDPLIEEALRETSPRHFPD